MGLRVTFPDVQTEEDGGAFRVASATVRKELGRSTQSLPVPCTYSYGSVLHLRYWGNPPWLSMSCSAVAVHA